nr:O-antigen ligase family protein [uncultured Flavobacterium sp.]
MKNKILSYTALLLLHVILALAFFAVPFLAKVYAFSILIIGVLYVIKKSNRNNEALYVAGYIVGSEVLLRMTGGSINYEFSKYGVILFMLIGMIYSGISLKSFPYWLFLILLIPGVIVSSITLNLETDIRKAILFNLSGPLCLGISAIYCYCRRITVEEINNLFLTIGLPIVAVAVYLFFYNASISMKDIVTGTGSNFATSGGFGPNQVSTVLGLGAFLFFTRVILLSNKKLILFLNLIIVSFISYRGFITFSRGGMITCGVMIILFLLIMYRRLNSQGKNKIVLLLSITFVAFLGVWSYSSLQTGGLIDKRYANQDALGREKKSKLTGREELAEIEFQMFIDNPVFGVGVGKNKEYREELTGVEAASHNEITRLMAEHGIFGFVAFMILLFTPLILYGKNKMHIYFFSLFFFWLLTINHAAMRIAAPGFIYALTLLKIYAIEKPTLHRE